MKSETTDHFNHKILKSGDQSSGECNYLDLGFHVLDGVGRLHLKGDGLAG